MSKRDFKYSLFTMLKLVAERPCIWDKTLEVYKDNMERRQAWKEILGILDDSYDDMTPAEKRRLEDMVICKWTNMRDSFIRNLRARAAGTKVKQYVYHDEMAFLKKIVGGIEDVDNDISTHKPLVLKVERNKRQRTEKIYFEEDSDHSVQEEVVTQNEYLPARCEDADPRVMNEDEAFFASLLPTVAQYSLEDRLEFRMEVLGVMKRIHANRKRFDDVID